MRISDWSSDVCSSDLAALRGTFDFRHRRLRPERHEVDSTEHAGDRPANWPVAAPDPVSERAVAHDHLDIAILEIGDKPPSPTQPRGEFTRALQGAVGIEQAVPPIDLERGPRVLEGRFRTGGDELNNRTERGPHPHQPPNG